MEALMLNSVCFLLFFLGGWLWLLGISSASALSV
jgi:hypothetical protein